MREREKGFTLIELLVVITIIATLAGLVVVIIPLAIERTDRMVCLENIRNITGLLEMSAADEARGLGDAPWPPHYPKQPGEPPRVQPSKRRDRDDR